MTVFVGDTVRWVWVSGSHTTTCDPANEPGTTLPSGAPTWDRQIRSSQPTDDYKVTVAGVYNYYCIPHAPSMSASFTAQTALPVRLSSFLLNGEKNEVALNWKTLNEQNTAYFSVRRSADGATYTEVARVPASGNSNEEKNYSYSDKNITAAQKFYYYNLAIVDKDGRQMISETKMYKNLRHKLK